MFVSISEGPLLSLCAGMRQLCSQEEEILNQIEQVVYNLEKNWHGEAEREYIRNFLTIKQAYTNIIEELKNYEIILRFMVTEYVETEKEYASKLQAI